MLVDYTDVIMKLCHKLQVYLFSLAALTLASCSMGPSEPEIYTNPIPSFTQLPSHSKASGLTSDIFDAFKQRRLTLGTEQQVLPYRGGSCAIPLLYSITPNNVGGIFANGQDLFAGAYAVLAFNGSNWVLRNSRARTSDIKPVDAQQAIEKHIDILKQYSLYLQLQGELTQDALDELAEMFIDNEMMLPSALLVDVKYHRLIKGSTLRNSQLYFSEPAATEGAYFLVSSPEQDDIDLIYQYKKGALLASNLIVANNFFKACNAGGTFVSQPTVNLKNKTSFTNELLIRGLPADADFGQLSRQSKLLEQGKYLTWLGKEKTYSVVLKSKDKCKAEVKAKVLAERCGTREKIKKDDLTSEKVVLGWKD